MNYLTKIKGRGRGLFLFLVMIVLLAPARMMGQESCEPPTDFHMVEGSLTPNSITFDWTPVGNETTWKIRYYDYDTYSETVIDGITEHPYTVTGLQVNTGYYSAQVCAVCEEGDVSEWEGCYEFTTPFCDPENQCELHYELWSSINWGWDEQAIRVYYKPTEGESILVQELFASGSYTEGDLLLCDGGIYDFVWYVGYTGVLDRCSFVIYGPDGEPILSYAAGEAPGSEYDDYEEMMLLEDYVFHCPSCEKPWDFSVEPTANSATFTWEAESGQTAWQFQYSTDQTNWNELPTVEETECSIDQLAPATHYYARVRSVCGVDDYSAWVRLDFYTDCATMVVDATHSYSENFDSYDPYDPWGGGEWKGLRMEVSDRLPLCWSSWNGSDDYEYSDYPYIYIYNDYWEMESNGLKFYVYNYEGEGAMMDQYAILPAMENINGLMMSFKAMDGESSTTEFSIGVMTNPTDVATFVEIQGFEVDDEWNDFEVYFGNYQGQGDYIAIKVGTPEEGESYHLYIDDIEVSVMPTCFVPSGFAMSNIGQNEATLAWEPYGNETAWQVRYSTDENSWTTVDYTEQDPGETVTKQLAGLNINTLYYVQVRANCGNEDYSAWSAMKSFRTLCGEYQPVPYYEDFETYQYPDLPQCWDRINTATDDSNKNYPLVTDVWDGEHDVFYKCLEFQFYTSIYFTPTDQTALLPRMENISSLQLSFDGQRTSVLNNYVANYKPVQVGVYDEEDNFHSIATIDLSTEAFTNYTVTFEGYTGSGDIGRIAVYVPYFKSGWTQYYVYIDNVSVTGQLDYKTFVTAGNWNESSCWENGEMPTSSSDNALIKAAAVIPSGCIATANVIDFNGNDASLTIEDGGQLICSNAVTATVKKSIANATNWGEGNYTPDGWYFFASPFTEDLWPGNVNNMYAGDYDLYRLNNTTWENYKNPVSGYFELVNGQGYLYANRDGVTLEFTGTTKPYTAGYTVEGTGWNLVGNPYTFNAYVNQSHYVLNSTRTAIEAAASNSAAIAPCTGVLVSGNATFYNAPQTQSNNQGNIQIALAQAATTRGNNHAETLDNAIVSFNEGEQLGKFYFGSQNANIYIPQGEEEYAIASSDKQGELPLNFKATENGTYTLSVNPEGVEMNYLHLIDNLTGADIDLLSTPSYTFNAKTTDYESRFRLVFVCGNVDGDNETFAFFANGQLIINGEGTAQVIDMLGRILINETVKGSTSKVIDQPAGIYMIRLINGENVKVQKVVVK